MDPRGPTLAIPVLDMNELPHGGDWLDTGQRVQIWQNIKENIKLYFATKSTCTMYVGVWLQKLPDPLFSPLYEPKSESHKVIQKT